MPAYVVHCMCHYKWSLCHSEDTALDYKPWRGSLVIQLIISLLQEDMHSSLKSIYSVHSLVASEICFLHYFQLLELIFCSRIMWSVLTLTYMEAEEFGSFVTLLLSSNPTFNPSTNLADHILEVCVSSGHLHDYHTVGSYQPLSPGFLP